MTSHPRADDWEHSREKDMSPRTFPVQSRHVLFRPMAAQLILANHSQVTALHIDACLTSATTSRDNTITYHHHLDSFQYPTLIYPRSFSITDYTPHVVPYQMALRTLVVPTFTNRWRCRRSSPLLSPITPNLLSQTYP